MIYRARQQQMSYGRPIGILMLEESIPYPPGAVGNPTTFSYPVRYGIVKGVGIDSLKNLNQPDSLQPFIDAAQALIDDGVCAISGNCGLMIVHQEAMAVALSVPVFMSSLLQLPFVASLFGRGARIGIMASSIKSLKPAHLVMAAGGADISTAMAAMDDSPSFRAAMSDDGGVLDFDKVEAEVVSVARDLVAQNPDIRALLFECTDLPPYAAAVQNAVGLPVFDITTLIDFVANTLVRKPFIGAY